MALMTNVQGNDTIFNAAAVIVAEGIGILCWLDALFLLFFKFNDNGNIVKMIQQHVVWLRYIQFINISGKYTFAFSIELWCH